MTLTETKTINYNFKLPSFVFQRSVSGDNMRLISMLSNVCSKVLLFVKISIKTNNIPLSEKNRQNNS